MFVSVVEEDRQYAQVYGPFATQEEAEQWDAKLPSDLDPVVVCVCVCVCVCVIIRVQNV